MKLLFIIFFLSVDGHHVDPAALFAEINEYRKSKGLHELKILPKKQKAVDRFARTLPKRFEHARGDFYENIAFSTDLSEIFSLWKNSSGHNLNMLNRKITHANVSIYTVKKDEMDYYYAVFRAY